jgi:transposase
MEATGVYHEQLAWFLHDKDKSVVILLPKSAKISMTKANNYAAILDW